MTLTSIIDPSIKIPRAFVKVTLGVGQRSPGSGAMRILLTGNKTASGSADVETLQELSGPDEAKELFGAGSELHLMAKAAFRAYKLASISAIAITSAGTAATKAITFGAGPAAAAGTVEVWVLGERVAVAVEVGDTITEIAAAVAAAITNKTDWPVTAAGALGVCTLTAKNPGPRGNAISVRSKLTGADDVTHTPATGYMGSGATMDDPQAALDAVASERFHLVVAPYDTATELGIYKTHLGDLAEPLAGKRGRYVNGFAGTLANCTTLSDGLNAPRGQIAWLEDPDDTPAMMAAALAATRAKLASADRATNTDNAIVVGLKPQPDRADIPDASALNIALNNGITPLLSVGSEVRIVREVTSYHLDSASNDDFSIIDVHYVEVPDFMADDIEANWYSQYQGFKIAPDSEDGPPGPRVATPKSVRAFIYGRNKRRENVLIVNVDENAEQLVVEIDPDVPSRMNAENPVDVIELFHQFGMDVRQIG